MLVSERVNRVCTSLTSPHAAVASCEVSTSKYDLNEKVMMVVGKVAIHTVYGRNPAPPGTYETLQIMGYLPYQLVQDFFHQQYQLRV